MKIRVTETKVYEYVPDLEEDFYTIEECKTMEDAIRADKETVNKGRCTMLELDDDPEVSLGWQLIDDDEKVILEL